jgi:hypothetical protein
VLLSSCGILPAEAVAALSTLWRNTPRAAAFSGQFPARLKPHLKLRSKHLRRMA